MILELTNLLWLDTPKGRGRALFVIDYGPESDLYWVVALDSGQIWTVENSKVGMVENWTLGRTRQRMLKEKSKHR